jgi:uncharacterized protein (DUF885 family)
MSQVFRIFDSLVQEFYEGWFRFYPQAALSAGVSGYEGGLPVVDDDETGALVFWLESLILALEELDYQALDRDRQLDLQLLFGASQEQYHMLVEQDSRHRDPLRYLPGCGVRQLVHAPQVERSEALKKYLAAVPEYLRHARGQLSALPPSVPEFWSQAALRQVEVEIAYLRGLKKSRMQLRGYENVARIHKLCDEAADALQDYLRFLEEGIAPHAQGDMGCGRSRYLQLLRHRHFLSVDPEKLHALIDRAHQQALESLNALCREQGDGREPTAWLQELATGNWSDGKQALEFARDHCRDLRRFLQQNNLVRIPAQAVDLRCLEQTEEVVFGECFSGYKGPACGDPDLQGDFYLELNGDLSPQRIIAQGIRNGWSGRHLLEITAAGGTASDSLLRRINRSPALIGGWMLYAEQMLFEQGFDTRPELSLLCLSEQVFRTGLALLDLELHVNGMGLEQALRCLRELPGVSVSRAENELLRLSRFPADAAAAVIGWRLIAGLRNTQEQEAPEFDLQAFHMRILEQGIIPPPLLIKQGVGEQKWRELCAVVGLV